MLSTARRSRRGTSTARSTTFRASRCSDRAGPAMLFSPLSRRWSRTGCACAASEPSSAPQVQRVLGRDRLARAAGDRALPAARARGGQVAESCDARRRGQGRARAARHPDRPGPARARASCAEPDAARRSHRCVRADDRSGQHVRPRRLGESSAALDPTGRPRVVHVLVARSGLPICLGFVRRRPPLLC